MKSSLILLALGVASSVIHLTAKSKPVRLGKGDMMFQTVPGWGLDKDGFSQLGGTHGGVVVSKTGDVFVSANKGVVVFNQTGKKLREYVGARYQMMHDIELREEGGIEYIYGARNKHGEGVKFKASDGEIVLNLPFPKDSGLNLKRFSPTAITVAPNGDIYLADGYSSNLIFRFNKSGKYLSHFGEKGNELKQFNTCHGMTLDTRYEPARLLICDRNHAPRGRLVHYSLEGQFIEVVITDLGMPTSVAVRGDYVSVPDLHGGVVILNKDNKIQAVLGTTPNLPKRATYGVKQDKWVEGVFNGTHGSYWDGSGNLYVQDWNVSGRIIKLVRL